MFCAMDVVLIYHVILTRRNRKKNLSADNGNGQPLLDGDAPSVTGLKRFLYVGAPATFDLLGTGFGMIGFVFLPASINQMLRGSTIVFSSIFSVVFLGKRMYGYNWLGVCLCMTGISLVGVSNVLGSSGGMTGPGGSSSAAAAFGMCSNLFGQIFASMQTITEE